MNADQTLRITLLTATLRAGGAERAALTLAEEFGRRGHVVSLLTWNSQSPDFYRVPGSVSRRSVGLAPSETFVSWFDVPGNLRRLRRIRRAVAVTRPDVVISFQDGTNELFLLASVNMPCTKLASCQNDITQRAHFSPRWEWVRKWVYRLADRVVFLDETQARKIQHCYPSWRCIGIPNPLPLIDSSPGEAEARIIGQMSRFDLKLSAMGRMVHQKGFDLLLEAFSGIKKAYPSVGLVILGDGPLRSNLETLRDNLGLQEVVLMPGAVQKPHSVIDKSDVFVFSSRFEGQGLALAEAMACGVAPVSFDCPSGPSNMIQNGVNGLLVPPEDVASMEKSISALLDDEPRRRMLADRARRISEELAPSAVYEQWRRLFVSLDVASGR